MKNFFVSLSVLSLSVFLLACGIEPVAVGVWDVEIETPEGNKFSVWSIGSDSSISMTSMTSFRGTIGRGTIGDTVTDADEVVLDGSRISWSVEKPDFQVPVGAKLRVNFNGSVNGNNLAGTIYTTLGNQTVRGSRR